jgi:hypothetical protein
LIQPGRRAGLEEVTKRKPRDPNQSDSLTTSLWMGSRSLMMISSSYLNLRHLTTKHHAAKARKEGRFLAQRQLLKAAEGGDS